MYPFAFILIFFIQLNDKMRASENVKDWKSPPTATVLLNT
jgi:hypothetical protein